MAPRRQLTDAEKAEKNRKQRERRAQEDPQTKAKRYEENRARATYRQCQTVTEDDRRARLETESAKRRECQARESEEVYQVRLRDQALRQQSLRDEENEEERRVRQIRYNERHRAKRIEETAEERTLCAMADRLRHQMYLVEETEEEAEIRRELNREQTANYRAAEKEEEREERREEKERTFHEELLAARNRAGVPRTHRAACKILASKDLILMHDCGEMTVTCGECNARHFKGEQPTDNKFTQCFAKGKECKFFFMDAAQAGEFRALSTSNGGCCRNLIEELDAMLREKNPYAAIYKMMRQVLEEEYRRAQDENLPRQTVGMIISRDRRNLDPRRYNSPTTNEITVIFKSANGTTFVQIDTQQPMCVPINMPYTTTTRREREEAAARAMDVDEEKEIDLPKLNEMLQLENAPVEALAGEEELVEEPEPEPEEQMSDDDNDPHRLNRGEGRRKRITHPPKALHSACPIQESNITIIINNQTMAPRRQLTDAEKAEKNIKQREKRAQEAPRLEKDHLDQEIQRQTQDEVDRQVRLDVEAQRRKENRAQEPDEIIQGRLQEQALRQQTLREEESEEERRARLRDQATRQQAVRDAETADDRRVMMIEDNLRHQMYLVEETEEEAEVHRELNREQTATYRGAENEEETRERVEQKFVPLETEEERTYHEAILAERNRTGLARTHRLACKTIVSEDHCPLHDCGAMDIVREECGAIHFKGERPPGKKSMQCCRKGKVILQPPKECPQPLSKFLQNNHPKSKSFMAKIRTYNSAHAFASLGASISSPPRRGPYCFRIHGQVYHNTTPVGTNTNNPKYANLYFMDAAQAGEFIADFESNGGCCRNLMAELDAMIREKNPYAAIYKMIRQVLKICRTKYPTTNEIAVLFKSANGEPPAKRDIQGHLFIPARGRTFIKYVNMPYTTTTRREREEAASREMYVDEEEEIQFQRLNERLLMQIPAAESAANDAFPAEELEPEPEEQIDDDENDPQRFNRGEGRRKRVRQCEFYSFLMSIRDYFNNVLAGGPLTQQWMVDSYVKIEANRVKYIREHQAELHVVQYNGLLDYINNRAERENMTVGSYHVLPSSFIGSPRAIKQAYQDAMSICGKFGKPVLGFATARIHVIEFQKRGLPHCHMLIWIDKHDAPATAKDVDETICAEIPDKTTHPRLYNIVMAHMIHGPCGSTNKQSPCMDGNICTKRFPKEFMAETIVNDNGFPTYRRRDTGVVHRLKRGHTHFEVDNRWVVPVKYIFKYVYKGYDCIKMDTKVETFQREAGDVPTVEWDEITSHLDARYVSAPEACWRIFKFPLSDRSHAICRLAVHLTREQSVFSLPGNEQQAAINAANKDTNLTAYFKLNSEDDNARQYFYREIPHHYVFMKKTNSWKPRCRRARIIGRLYTVGVRQVERHCLRLLLIDVKGETSFEHLQTVDGLQHATFKSAAIALNLLEDDRAWSTTMEDAAVFQMPAQLRQLYVDICLYCNPTDATTLFDANLNHLMANFIRSGHDANVAKNLTLKWIQDKLRLNNKTMEEFSLPVPDFHLINQLIDAQMEKTTTTQYFLDGPGGTRKTLVYNTLINVLQGQGKQVIAVASTGIALTLLLDGATYHSQFKIYPPITETTRSKIEEGTYNAQMIRNASLIILDEATMNTNHALDAINYLFQTVMKNRVDPYGGKVFLVGGDFRQCLPVVRHGNRIQVAEATIINNATWPHFHHFRLVQNMRTTAGSQDYADWLIELGNGTLPQIPRLNNPDVIEIPQDFLNIQRKLVEHVFGDPSDLLQDRVVDFMPQE
ncbi:Uncharacterized protein APZ42_033417 [Daphnia magna]|uniref:ATP-dependent DNA helicase n=1 Tax=Daphnia magna TaxID=35525 RepID=A0A164L421_9CRUS|nr:Uncharacterized protein APZ42_033417 [Daphnia magna]